MLSRHTDQNVLFHCRTVLSLLENMRKHEKHHKQTYCIPSSQHSRGDNNYTKLQTAAQRTVCRLNNIISVELVVMMGYWGCVWQLVAPYFILPFDISVYVDVCSWRGAVWRWASGWSGWFSIILGLHHREQQWGRPSLLWEKEWSQRWWADSRNVFCSTIVSKLKKQMEQ